MSTRVTKHHEDHRSFLAAFYSSKEPAKFNDPYARLLGFIDEFNVRHTVRLTGCQFWCSEELKMFFIGTFPEKTTVGPQSIEA